MDVVECISGKKYEYCFDITFAYLVGIPFAGWDPPLKKEVIEWMEENSISEYDTFADDTYHCTGHLRYFIEFENQQDAVAFKLRWL